MVIGTATLTAEHIVVDFAAFVKCAFLLTRQGMLPECSGLPHPHTKNTYSYFLRRQFGIGVNVITNIYSC